MDETLTHSSAQKPRVETEHQKDEIPVPNYWTTLIHGTNLGRKEWEGDRRKVLDLPEFELKAQGLGLSCITTEEKQRQAERSQRMGANYDTTRGFSTVPEGFTNEPVEIDVLFPAFHNRTKLKDEAVPEYQRKFGPERAQSVLELADKVHWKRNNQHPVLPNGLKLKKLDDVVTQNGVRKVTYVPEVLSDIYEQEIG